MKQPKKLMNFFPHWGNYQKSSIQKISKEAGLREKKVFGKIMKTEDQSNSFLPLKPIINQPTFKPSLFLSSLSSQQQQQRNPYFWRYSALLRIIFAEEKETETQLLVWAAKKSHLSTSHSNKLDNNLLKQYSRKGSGYFYRRLFFSLPFPIVYLVTHNLLR